MLVLFRQVPESFNAFSFLPLLAMQNFGYFIIFTMFTNKVSNKNLVSLFFYLIAGSDILNMFNLLDSAFKCQRGFHFIPVQKYEIYMYYTMLSIFIFKCNYELFLLFQF